MRTPAIAVAFASLLAGTAHSGVGTAVGFYNPALRHYFLTANPAEAAALDAGTPVKGWTRTGGQFTVFTDPAPGLSAVCRFFGTPGNGPNSHFYTADAAECAKVKTLPAWTFEEISFYIPTTGNGDCGSNWPVYRSYYSDQIADANHRFTIDLTAHVRMKDGRGDILEGIVMCAPVTDEEREADVVRFLEQATLGPTEALVQEVKAKGIEKWLDEQLAMNLTRYTQYPFWDPPQDLSLCQDDGTPPITPEKYCRTNLDSELPVAWEFFAQSRTAPDQVRMRMAHVWHQLYVMTKLGPTYANAEFQQRLRDHALGSFEDLLLSYSLSPALGVFQSWVNNVPEHDGIKPNENYARELMQIFTMGVNRMNDDGSLWVDGNGRLVPTYSQADVETLARVLTGFTYPPQPGKASAWSWSEVCFAGDMVPFDDYHDKGAKSALDGLIAFAAGGGAMAEVRGAHRALVNHPNTPPFISKQLIQKLVTSSPTPGYVSRVSAVFKDNGKGVRGDLASVVRAVLLDPEARGARKIDPEYGRLREPVLFLTAMIRGLEIITDGLIPWNYATLSGQQLFWAPTVFNYYPADYTLAGGSIPGAEFAIYTSAEFMNRANTVNDILYNPDYFVPCPGCTNNFEPQPFVRNAMGTHSPALTAFLADAADADRLVRRLDRLFLHGTMSDAARNVIVSAVDKLDPGQALRRVKLAVNLVLVAIDYQVQK